MICAHCTEVVPSLDLCPRCGAATALEGRYRLLEAIGSGSFGTTYRAERLADGRVVAVKEMLVRRADSLKVLELFTREARVLEQLDHPGIPKYFEDFTHDAGRSTAFFLVQEYIEGEPLNRRFAGRLVRVDDVFGMMAELLDTLVYLHSFSPPVVHRDIKPANVMRRDADGSLVLIDFGSVRAALGAADGGSTVAGTFGFMAPEQFAGRAEARSDVYGVAATAVALLAGVEPHELTGPDRQIDVGRLQLEPRYAEVLRAMLAADASRRPTAREAAAAIRDTLAGRRSSLSQPATGNAVGPPPHLVAALAQMPSNLQQLVATQFGVTQPAPLVTLPPPPRPLPPGLMKTYGAKARFQILFGALFGGLGGGIPTVVGISLASAGFTEPLGFIVIFPLVFGGIGGTMFVRGVRRRAVVRRLWAEGVEAVARCTEVGTSSYAVNDRRANVYRYRFEVDGAPYTGRWDSWDWLPLGPGTEAKVLYLQEDPTKNLLVARLPGP